MSSSRAYEQPSALRCIGVTTLITLTALLVVMACACRVQGAAPVGSVLCEENATQCPGESVYPSGTSIEAAEGTLVLLTESFLGNEECQGSSLTGKTTSQEGVSLEITSFSFPSSCSPCTSAKAENLPYKGSLEATGGGDGLLALIGSGGGVPQIKLSGCPLGVTCVYATLVKEEGNILCPESGKLDAEYEVVSPEPAFASAES